VSVTLTATEGCFGEQLTIHRNLSHYIYVTAVCKKMAVYFNAVKLLPFFLLDTLVIAVPFSVSRYSLSLLPKKNLIDHNTGVTQMKNSNIF
jgi:hypothetical protein